MKTKLNILLIEDNELFALMVQKLLGSLGDRYRVTHVLRVSEAVRELNSQQFDVAVTDLMLPDATLLESVDFIRETWPDLPLIVLTLLESMELASLALQAGAQDFIVKDMMTAPLLERSIRNAIERQKMVAENDRLIATLKSQRLELDRKNVRLKQLVDTTYRFADNVSHEFRTPLTVIREYASLVRDELLGEINKQQAEFMDVIVYRVDDLTRMVDDMLDSSKLEAGIMGMHRISTHPAEVTRSALTGLRLKTDIRGIELTCDSDDCLPTVFCDPEKAGRVVTNLVANAIKFTEDGTGQIHVGIQHRPESGEVEFSISDNGPGIAPGDLKRMFDRFQQLGTSTQSSTKGFGLGLNIARELVDLNYGSISVESELDKGTTFRFTVPVDDWPEIVRRYCARLSANDTDAVVAVVSVRTLDDFTEAGCRDMGSFWRFTQRPTDLIRETDQNEWKLLFACSPQAIDTVIDRFKSEHAEVSRNRPQPLPQLEFKTLGCFSANDQDAVLAAACEDATCLA